MPIKRWRLIVGVVLVLGWPLSAQAGTQGRTEISVGFLIRRMTLTALFQRAIFRMADGPMFSKRRNSGQEHDLL